MTPNQPMRGFYHLSRAWYADANREADVQDRVTFGWYVPGDGTTGELSMQWEWLAGDWVPCLRVYGDAFEALNTCSDVVERLVAYTRPHSSAAWPALKEYGQRMSHPGPLTPDAFCALLLECGFVDLTPVEAPQDASTL